MDFRSDALNPAGRSLALLIAVVTAGALVSEVLVTLRANPGDLITGVLWELARYFTDLTNLLVLISFATMFLLRRSLGRSWMGALTVWIVMTGAVYHALLYKPATGLAMVANQGLHTVVPLLVLAFWCFLAPKKRLRYRAAIPWLLWPLAYAGYAFWRGQQDGLYPYFFLDPKQDGWDGVVVWIGLLALVFLVAGYVVIWLGRLFSRAP